jgi:AraC-like DNA-binding protein
MDFYGISKLNIKDVDVAADHFYKYDNVMEIMPASDGSFRYEKCIYFLGGSFVSRTTSLSGWGYHTHNEVDGFLLTIPHVGDMHWKTSGGLHRVSAGEAVLTDQRAVLLANYSTGIRYTTVYIANSDFSRYLSIITGSPARNRLFFHKNRGGSWEITFIIRLVETIMDLGLNSKGPTKELVRGIKETLIGFILYNFKNNYDPLLSHEPGALTVTPRCINQAAEFMAASTDPHLTICEIAAHAGISVRSLQMGFKRFKHTTPIVFLRERRLEHAHEMLKKCNTTASAKEVALLCGFSNYQVFCKYFIERYARHPTALLKNISEADE